MIWGPQYTRKKAIADLIAGVTVGLTVLPQGLAYATVAGLPPIYGLYSSFVGPFVYILFGGTKAITIGSFIYLISRTWNINHWNILYILFYIGLGPTAIQSILTNKYTFGKPPEYAVFLCAVTAVVTLFMGIFKLGKCLIQKQKVFTRGESRQPLISFYSLLFCNKNGSFRISWSLFDL